ncbi:endonuclease/exonuclease/phosphatase family protein [Citricoccus sp. GCM10030269]|uniref:endonuclease/exonuclease/phosphatase family protein n=1 Tax=Citricoccus sp. GCM10030269 TaxID=3273388 RepID=UPI0036130B91
MPTIRRTTTALVLAAVLTATAAMPAVASNSGANTGTSAASAAAGKPSQPGQPGKPGKPGQPGKPSKPGKPGQSKHDVRFATYNASLNRASEGQLMAGLSTPENEQAQNIAEVIQINDPDVVLVNEFDYVPGGAAAEAFRDNYLATGQNGQDPVDYPYYYTAPVNTGVPSGLDLNQDGTVGGPDDAWGFGEFPGQYGMVVYSKYPIDTVAVRTFQNFRWQDMPDNEMPEDYYTDEQEQLLPLSSKSHWDVPVQVGNKTVHVLAAHPTPPSFDGPEDRNGRKNNDEIRFWSDYVSGGTTASYIYDDAGQTGGLPAGERFVVLGDYNSDPNDGDSYPGTIEQLLDNPRVNDPLPESEGGVEAAARQGGLNAEHVSDPRYDTADFTDDPGPGNLRADYVLPSDNMPLRDSGIFWPTPGEPGSELTGEYPFPTSDHRLVWVDVKVPGRR